MLSDKLCFTTDRFDSNGIRGQEAEFCTESELGVPVIARFGGRWTLVGLMSDSYQCARSKEEPVQQVLAHVRKELRPVIFTQVNYYEQWIADRANRG